MIITIDDIRKSVNTVYVFGDNLDREGHGGQAAVARDFVKEGKAFGIPTKRHPGNHEGDFFSDKKEEIFLVNKSFSEIEKMIRAGKKIIFFPNIGEGLADLQHRSPIILGLIRNFIAKCEKRLK